MGNYTSLENLEYFFAHLDCTKVQFFLKGKDLSATILDKLACLAAISSEGESFNHGKVGHENVIQFSHASRGSGF